MPAATFATADRSTHFWGNPIAIERARTNRFNSDVSTADTIGILRTLAHRYKGDPFVQMANAQALSYLGSAPSDRDVACAIFYWVRSNIRFVEDEQVMYGQLGVMPEDLDKELLIVPPTLLSMPEPMGDCDDFSLLIACQLLNAGVRPFFVTVAADPNDRRKFSHIYVCAELADEGTYLCLDAGNRMHQVPPGWELQSVSRKAIWNV